MKKNLQTFCSLADRRKQIELVEKFNLMCFHAEIQTLVVVYGGSEMLLCACLLKQCRGRKAV